LQIVKLSEEIFFKDRFEQSSKEKA